MPFFDGLAFFEALTEPPFNPPAFSIDFVSNENTVASFSSRGPNSGFSLDIMKPDIIAPGIDVLAASTPLAAGVNDAGRDDFGYLDGTSMASPHGKTLEIARS